MTLWLTFVSANAQPLFEATPLTEAGSFTSGVEGPACDSDGNIFAVCFEKQGTIGKITPDGKSSLFIDLPGDQCGNGIRFDASGRMFIADYVGHNVLTVDPGSNTARIFAHDDHFNQPNDLTITDDGTLYLSDPDWKNDTGKLWRVDSDGTITLLRDDRGTTNGIEVSPDGKTLYVNESVQRKLWAYKIADNGSIDDGKVIVKFPDGSSDGMRCDVDGNLYVTRHGNGVVEKYSPTGQLLKTIDVLGERPTNICFGGPDGRTAYITEAQQGRLVSFRVDSPGSRWSKNQAASDNAIAAD